jgi:hypothetical protein
LPTDRTSPTAGDPRSNLLSGSTVSSEVLGYRRGRSKDGRRESRSSRSTSPGPSSPCLTLDVARSSGVTQQIGRVGVPRLLHRQAGLRRPAAAVTDERWSARSFSSQREQTAPTGQSQRDGPIRTARAGWTPNSSPRLSWKSPPVNLPGLGPNECIRHRAATPDAYRTAPRGATSTTAIPRA